MQDNLMNEIIPTPSVYTHRDEQEWNNKTLAVPVVTPKIKFWKYCIPAVVLGCSQRGSVSRNDSYQRAGIDAIGRRAGGGAVLVGPWMLSVSVVLSHPHPLVANSPMSSYQWIGETFVTALKKLEINADIVGSKSKKQRSTKSGGRNLDWACFGSLSPWEVTVADKKIVGLAQVRGQTGVLLVAGLLISCPDWSLLYRALNKLNEDANGLKNVSTSCEEQLGKVIVVNEIIQSLWDLFSKKLGLINNQTELMCKNLVGEHLLCKSQIPS